MTKNTGILLLTLGVVGIITMYKTRGWSVPTKANQWLGIFDRATAQYNLPPYLLIRVAEQESDFNPKAHNKKSNAQGMMQIVPKWHEALDDPFNPNKAIPYAAKYLRTLYNQFGNWQYALMAYNWGPGNVTKWIASGKTTPVPKETQNYHFEILRDVRNARGIA